MSFGTALVVIVAILAYTAIRISRHNSRHPQQDLPKAADDADARREIAELKERIKVLERIATDGNTLDASETRRIAAEIESLREKQG